MPHLPAGASGPLDALRAAVRRRAPQVIISVTTVPPAIEPDTAEPGGCVSVSYRCAGPRRIVWDETLGVYQWHSGPDTGAHLGSDPGQAAGQIAARLGVPPDPGPPSG